MTANQRGIPGATNSTIKVAYDTLMSWRHSKRDPTFDKVLEVNDQYTDWIIKITHQFKMDECFCLIKPDFYASQVATFYKL